MQIKYRAPQVAARILTPPSVWLGSTAHHKMNAFSWPSYQWFQSMLHETGSFRNSDSATWVRPLKTVMYDPEGWPKTPLPERRNPAVFFRRFAELGHAHGWTVIITPHPNLTSVPGAACAARPGESETRADLRCDLTGQAARFADVVEVQAQGLQRDAAAYRAFVGRAAEQARSANPHVLVIAGLSTGRGYRPEQMLTAWASVRGLVDGYYLSIAGNERLAVALQFLRRVVEQYQTQTP